MKIKVNLPVGDSAELTGEEIDAYLPYYPMYTPASVIESLARVKRSFGKLDMITVNHYIVEIGFGGLGHGVQTPQTDDEVQTPQTDDDFLQWMMEPYNK